MRLAPLPGCGAWGDSVPVVSLRSTTGYKLTSLRLGAERGMDSIPAVSLRSTTGYRLASLRLGAGNVGKS